MLVRSKTLLVLLFPSIILMMTLSRGLAVLIRHGCSNAVETALKDALHAACSNNYTCIGLEYGRGGQIVHYRSQDLCQTRHGNFSVETCRESCSSFPAVPSCCTRCRTHIVFSPPDKCFSPTLMSTECSRQRGMMQYTSLNMRACECINNYLYWPPHDRCYHAGFRGPCESDKYFDLVMTDGKLSPSCIPFIGLLPIAEGSFGRLPCPVRSCTPGSRRYMRGLCGFRARYILSSDCPVP